MIPIIRFGTKGGIWVRDMIQDANTKFGGKWWKHFAVNSCKKSKLWEYLWVMNDQLQSFWTGSPTVWCFQDTVHGTGSVSVGSTIPTLFIMLVVHHTHTFFDPNRAPGRSQNKLPWPQRQARKQIAMARCEKKSQQFCCKTCLQVSCLDPSMVCLKF